MHSTANKTAPSPIERPLLNNAHLADRDAWLADNEAELRRYHGTLRVRLPEGTVPPTYEAFALYQHHMAELRERMHQEMEQERSSEPRFRSWDEAMADAVGKPLWGPL